MAIYGSNFDYGDSHYKDEGDVAPSTGEFYFLPNWKFPVKLSYSFETPISITRRKYEQRKPLRRIPLRKETFTFTGDIDYEDVWHYLIEHHAESMTIPIYTEPCIPIGTGSLAGVNSIIVNDISGYYNLNNLTLYVIVIDRLDIVDAEILLLNNIENGNTINLIDSITGAFPRERTVMFPIFEAYLESHRRKDNTDTMTTIEVIFKEQNSFGY